MEDVSKLLREMADEHIQYCAPEIYEQLRELSDRCERMEDLVRKSVIRPLKHCPNCNFKLT